MNQFTSKAWFKLFIGALALAALYYLQHVGYWVLIEQVLSDRRWSTQLGGVVINPYIVLRGLLIIIAIFWLTAVLIDLVSLRISRRTSINASTRNLLITLVQVLFYIVAGLVTLNMLQINLSALAVLGGAIGIGLGFGLQKIAANFISGIILLLEKSIRVGDLVELDSGLSGFVRQTHARYTLLEGFDGREVMVPNEDFIISRVTNLTFSDTKGRLSFKIGVSYNSDLEKVKSLLVEVVRNHSLVLDEPAPAVYLTEFGDSAVVFLVQVWIRDIVTQRWTATNDLNFAIWQKLKENNVEIPFPQRVIHLKKDVD
ncbi:mechanosensitive ion channel [Alphaproteobacteria bacterium]|nr:mechanosensitive ion channel [Alphaproteobacteria bacterium]